MDLTTLRAFESYLGAVTKGFKVKFKEDTWWMRVLGFFMFPINPLFLTTYTTTIGNTVYFATREKYEANPEGSMMVLAHENVHAWDSQASALKFKFLYLFPQALAVIPLLVFLGLALPHSWVVLLPLVGYTLAALIAKVSMPGFWVTLAVTLLGVGVATAFFTGWASFALLAGLVCLLPWPAPWRMKFEYRGYAMDMAYLYWTRGVIPIAFFQNLIEVLTGSSYYFMSWSSMNTRNALLKFEAVISNGAIQEEMPYKAVHEFLKQQGTLVK